MTKKFYITTAIDYPNAEPHIGHAYQKIIADILTRWHKLLGENVWFLTGTDEHGKKIQESAEKAGKSPKKFVDEMALKFQEAWKTLNIEPNRFIRTTDKDHEKLVQEIIKKCNKTGDIYKGFYEGLYCTPCEAYYTEKDLINGECSFHPGKKITKIKEESYFFKLSKYQKFLLEHYKKHSEFILPKERRNEIIKRVEEGLKDLSISRTSFSWGIPFPLNKKHITYVWMDALFNYVSGAGKNQEFWPADVHLLGKDNSWFHCVYWPAFLKSAGLKLPKTIFVHGFLTFNGQKISKTLGNVISPKFLAEKYGADTIRYFICRQFPFAEGNDGDFSEKYLVERHNNELADKLGNLVSRVVSLIEKYGIKKTKNKLIKKLNLKKIEKYFDNYELDKALNEIFAFIDSCNEYIQSKKPWENSCKDKEKILYEVADSIKAIAILLWPFMPETSEKIAKQFNFKIELKEITKYLNEKNKIVKEEILFKKIEFGKSEEKIKEDKINKSKTIEGIMEIKQVEFSDWQKLDLRVAEIKKIEDIAGADKLYKLEIDAGKEIGKRTICAGIKPYYTKEQLKNKKIIYFSNLNPRMLKGIESQGMLLAASIEGHSTPKGVPRDISEEMSTKGKVVLISPEKDIENGSRIG